MTNEPMTIDLTPQWSGILPALLDVIENGSIKLEADNAAVESGRVACNMFNEGWCGIHSSMYADNARLGDSCAVASSRSQYDAWRKNTASAIADIKAEFRKMAKAADRYNALAKVIKEQSSKVDDRGGVDNYSTADALNTIIDRLQAFAVADSLKGA